MSATPPPPPRPDDVEPTVAMPRVEPGTAPPQPPPRPATVMPPAAVEEARIVGPAPPGPPGRRVGAQRRYTFGNPFGYTLSRFCAFAIDLGLVAGVLTVLAYALIAINPLTGLPTNSQRGFDATLAMGIVLALVYEIVAVAIAGTSIGKLAFGLHVYGVRGDGVGFGRAFIRSLLRPIDALVVGPVLSLLPGHRRLGDLLGGTIVARGGPLRTLGTLVGWILILIVGGLPFILAGTERTLAGMFAFGEFVPGLIARIVHLVTTLGGAIPH
ncbi:MAG: RDD family protein [Candidatus Eremiobacteraeota bacterium]|nr:RDD family protein [Candidatus Eremiobacteraeota bacterium]